MVRIVHKMEVVKKPRAPRRDARQAPKQGPKQPLVQYVFVQHATTKALLDVLEVTDRYGDQVWSLYVQKGTRLLVEQTDTVTAWRIRWDEVYPSQNVLMRKYANQHAYAALIAKWEKIFWAAMLDGRIPKARGRRRLTITRFVRSEKYVLDRGNLVGGGKPFLDAAVRAGLIRDDKEADVDDQYRQAIDRDERVEILVEDI